MPHESRSAPQFSRRQALMMAVGAAAATGASLAPGGAALAATAKSSAKAPAGEWNTVAAACEKLIAEHLTPGVSVSVMRAGALLYSNAFGYANLETSTRATPQHVFRIGSISKQFAGAALCQLAEDGKLSLDDKLSRFLPLFPRAGDITLRQMLNHTSGLGNYTETSPREAFFRDARVDYDDPALLAAMAATSPLFKTEPGVAWAYSNTAYVLLGLVVQVVAQESWKSYYARRLFAPAGMTQTAVDDAADLVANRASGYSRRAGTQDQFANAAFISMTFPHAAGALRSTTEDLCRWHQALLGGRIVKPESLAQMMLPGRLANGSLPEKPADPAAKPDTPKASLEYGFGLEMGDFEGHRYVGHGGGIFGFLSMLRSFKAEGLSVAMLVNSDAIDSAEGAKQLFGVVDVAARVALARA